MPCGGIYPIEALLAANLASSFRSTLTPDKLECFHCRQMRADHWLIEWDSYLHGKCVVPFLATEEGKVILDHQHDIHIAIRRKPDVFYCLVPVR